ncbi:MAG: phosphoribosylamine--glycine ligase [candidate division WOR-3 bacterium]|nr:phosphoribosylamine--glycine ligase [candidate division WOR-3 bacterium]
MNVLVVGGGGREHALVWKINKSRKVKNLYAAPGNPGIAKIATCVNILPTDINGLVRFAKEKNIDLTVVGPELPLSLGIVDEFNKNGLKIFGPTRAASRIESDKSFAREFLAQYDIPSPKFQIYDSAAQALKYLKTINTFPVVVKAAGLAGGKGVFIVNNKNEYERIVDEVLVQHKLGEAGKKIVVEEFLTGQECSVFVLTDGLRILYLPSAQDHKRLYDGNRGPNTGGMGAYSPYPMSKLVTDFIKEVIVQPTILCMHEKGFPFKGVLYAGLIITPSGPKVLEFNCRFGDPEFQAMVPLIENDIIELFLGVVDNNLQDLQVKIKNLWSICVVLVSAGYPFDYKIGEEIQIKGPLDTGTLLFHAGTKIEDGKLVTAGGRVLNVVYAADNLRVAKQKVYEEIKKIHFNGMFYRKDIGSSGMKKMKRKRKVR